REESTGRARAPDEAGPPVPGGGNAPGTRGGARRARGSQPRGRTDRTSVAGQSGGPDHGPRQGRSRTEGVVMNPQTRATGNLERRIHDAESSLFAAVGADVGEFFLDLARTGLRVRV